MKLIALLFSGIIALGASTALLASMAHLSTSLTITPQSSDEDIDRFFNMYNGTLTRQVIYHFQSETTDLLTSKDIFPPSQQSEAPSSGNEEKSDSVAENILILSKKSYEQTAQYFREQDQETVKQLDEILQYLRLLNSQDGSVTLINSGDEPAPWRYLEPSEYIKDNTSSVLEVSQKLYRSTITIALSNPFHHTFGFDLDTVNAALTKDPYLYSYRPLVRSIHTDLQAWRTKVLAFYRENAEAISLLAAASEPGEETIVNDISHSELYISFIKRMLAFKTIFVLNLLEHMSNFGGMHLADADALLALLFKANDKGYSWFVTVDCSQSLQSKKFNILPE